MATARLAKPKRKRRKPPTKPQPLAPETTPNEPDGRLVLLPNRISGVRVDEDTAMTLGAVFACVRLIAEDIAGLPMRVFEHRATGKGADERPDDPADWILHTQANPETPAFQWRETTIAHALTWGNGYSEIERDMAGRPVWLWQLTPDRVEVSRTNNGKIVYDVYNPREPNTVLEKEDVFHLRGLGFDGLVGYSVIRMAARAIGIGIATEDASSTLFANDTTPGGILMAKTKLKPEAVDNLRQSWQQRHGGPSKRRTVAILEEGLTWQQTGLPPEDAQLIQQRQITPSDIARWFRVSPPKIGDLSRATFSNVEELSIWHVTDTLMPWIRRLETEGNIKLFRPTNRGKRFTKINMNALLRGKLADRQSYLTAMLDRGVLDINETRDLEDMNPIGADGDKRFVQANMQLLENAGVVAQDGSGADGSGAADEGIRPIDQALTLQRLYLSVNSPKPLITADEARDIANRAGAQLEGPAPKPDAVPAPTGQQPAPSEDPDNEEADTEENTLAIDALRPIVHDVCARIARRADHRIRDALKRFNGKHSEFAAWVVEFMDEHGKYASESITPVVKSAAKMLRIDENGELIKAFVNAHVVRIASQPQAIDAAAIAALDANDFLAELTRCGPKPKTNDAAI